MNTGIVFACDHVQMFLLAPTVFILLLFSQSHHISHTLVMKHETSDNSTIPDTPSEEDKKRKMKTDMSDMMAAFMDMLQKQHDEFMREELLHHQQEQEMLDNWMKAKMEMEDRWHQVQREKR